MDLRASGIDLSDENVLRDIDAAFTDFATRSWLASPLLGSTVHANEKLALLNPANHDDVVGHVIEADADDVETALDTAHGYAMDWQTLPPAERARGRAQLSNALT